MLSHYFFTFAWIRILHFKEFLFDLTTFFSFAEGAIVFSTMTSRLWKSPTCRPEIFMAERISIDPSFSPSNLSDRELKVYETNTISSPTFFGGNAGKVFVIAPGTEDFQRVGKKITLRQIRARGCVSTIDTYATLPPVPDILRILLVLDKQANKAASIFLTDIFTSPSTVWSEYNYKNADRFVILDEQWFNVSPRGAVADCPTYPVRPGGGFVPDCKLYTACLDMNLPVYYGNLFDPTTNDVYWVVLNLNQRTQFDLRFTTYYLDD